MESTVALVWTELATQVPLPTPLFCFDETLSCTLPSDVLERGTYPALRDPASAGGELGGSSSSGGDSGPSAYWLSASTTGTFGRRDERLRPRIGLPVSGLRSPARKRGGGVRTRRVSRERERTTCEWTAHDTQYSIFMCSFGTTYTSYTEASFRSRWAAASTMLRTTMRLMALS